MGSKKKATVRAMGRPKQKSVKINTCIRLYQKDREALIKKFGGLQPAIDFLVNKHFNKTDGIQK